MINDEVEEIVLFDGVCNLCNGSVRFLLLHEKDKSLRFASLQSEYGKRLLKKNNLPTDKINSIVYIKHKRVYRKSTAVLQLTKKMKGLYPIFSIFLFIPSFIRDGVYNIIARNRYKWFGKKDYCMVPTPDLLSRFLDK